MKNASIWIGAGLALGAALPPAAAQAPVAVVEDVRGKVAGVEFMDYVAAGRVIQLGAKDVLVLGYMKSCARETITGGTVTVGEQQSTVRAGRVERTQTPCGGTRQALGAPVATQSAATVFRSMRRDAAASAAAPAPVLLYGQSPVLDVGAQRGRVLIERTDESGERQELATEGPALLRERFLDLARAGVALKPGASYAVSLGPLKAAFKIDWAAEPGAAPLVGRLLRLE